MEYLEKPLKIRVEIGDKSGECATRFNMGSIYYTRDEVEKAYKSWKEVYVIAKEIEYAQVLEALESLAGQLGLEGGLGAWAKNSFEF